MNTSGNLSNLQLELLKLFRFDLSENQLIELKTILSKYFAEKTTNEVDKLWEENKWDEKTIEDWKNDHLRIKYE